MPIPGGLEVFALPLLLLAILLALGGRYVYRWFSQGYEEADST